MPATHFTPLQLQLETTFIEVVETLENTIASCYQLASQQNAVLRANIAVCCDILQRLCDLISDDNQSLIVRVQSIANVPDALDTQLAELFATPSEQAAVLANALKALVDTPTSPFEIDIAAMSPPHDMPTNYFKLKAAELEKFIVAQSE